MSRTRRVRKHRFGRTFAFAAVVVLAGGAMLDPGTEACCRCSGAEPGDNASAGKGGHGRMAGKGEGQGGGCRGGGRHHDSIDALLDDHDKIERTVTEIDGGVETITTSSDEKVAETIRLHVRQMEGRMETGHPMRRWDPLFAELFRHHEEIEMHIEDVPGGVKVREISDNPEVAALIRQHAVRAVSEFVAEGHERYGRPTPMPEDEKMPEIAARPPCPGR